MATYTYEFITSADTVRMIDVDHELTQQELEDNLEDFVQRSTAIVREDEEGGNRLVYFGQVK